MRYDEENMWDYTNLDEFLSIDPEVMDALSKSYCPDEDLSKAAYDQAYSSEMYDYFEYFYGNSSGTLPYCPPTPRNHVYVDDYETFYPEGSKSFSRRRKI